jgi:hypothetical protein
MKKKDEPQNIKMIIEEPKKKKGRPKKEVWLSNEKEDKLGGNEIMN